MCIAAPGKQQSASGRLHFTVSYLREEVWRVRWGVGDGPALDENSAEDFLWS